MLLLSKNDSIFSKLLLTIDFIPVSDPNISIMVVNGISAFISDRYLSSSVVLYNISTLIIPSTSTLSFLTSLSVKITVAFVDIICSGLKSFSFNWIPSFTIASVVFAPWSIPTSYWSFLSPIKNFGEYASLIVSMLSLENIFTFALTRKSQFIILTSPKSSSSSKISSSTISKNIDGIMSDVMPSILSSFDK